MKSTEFVTENLEEETLDEWSDTHPGIKKELKQKGYKFLGKGVDQSAYLEPGTGQVLKIFGTQSGTSGSGGHQLSDDQKMFVTWAKLCNKNADNPFLPKFSGFERFVFQDQTYFQIRQERLKEIGPAAGDWLETIALTIEDYGFTSAKAAVDLFRREAAENEHRWGPDEYLMLVKKLGEEETTRLIATIFSLNKIANQKGYTFDLHAGNFMMRGKTPVITDPWVHPSGHSGW